MSREEFQETFGDDPKREDLTIFKHKRDNPQEEVRPLPRGDHSQGGHGGRRGAGGHPPTRPALWPHACAGEKVPPAQLVGVAPSEPQRRPLCLPWPGAVPLTPPWDPCPLGRRALPLSCAALLQIYGVLPGRGEGGREDPEDVTSRR